MLFFFSAGNNTNTTMDTSTSEFWNTSNLSAIAAGGSVILACLFLNLWHRYNRNQYNEEPTSTPEAKDNNQGTVEVESISYHP